MGRRRHREGAVKEEGLEDEGGGEGAKGGLTEYSLGAGGLEAVGRRQEPGVGDD